MSNSPNKDQLTRLVTQGETNDNSFAFEVFVLVAFLIFVALAFSR